MPALAWRLKRHQAATGRDVVEHPDSRMLLKRALTFSSPSAMIDVMGEEAISPYEACLAALDTNERILRRRIISNKEYEQRVKQALLDYFPHQGPTDDIDFLVAYAREPIVEWAEDPLHGDREATDRFDVILRQQLHRPVAEANLRELLDEIRSAVSKGDPSGIGTLIDLCGAGNSTHPRIYLYPDHAEETLALARDLGAVPALVAAIDPKHHSYQQLGHPDEFAGRIRRFTFRCLAELAAQNTPVGNQALDALVDLCQHMQTAAQAAVHIPAFRLQPDHRAALLNAAEAIDDLIAANTYLLPAHEANRAPDAIRSVLWIANDAARINGQVWN